MAQEIKKTDSPKEILGMNLHVAQFVGADMCSNINSVKHKVKMTLTAYGVTVTGQVADKLIPFSNIQGIDFKRIENED